MRSVTVDFNSFDFNRPLPSCTSNSTSYNPNTYFAIKTCVLHVDSTNHGIIPINIRYAGNPEYVSVCFVPPNGNPVGVGTTLNGLYGTSSTFSPINFKILDFGNTQPSLTTLYLIVNGSGTTDTVNINVSVGARGNQPSGVNVTIEYGDDNDDCIKYPIYSYNTGLHVYSPYDAQGYLSKLRTILYSLTPINNWVVDTRVWSTALFSNAALPWYYGYGDYVFKVGGPFDRAYGYYDYYHIWKNSFSNHVHQNLVRIGPQWWIEDPNNEPFHKNCINPLMTDLGLIKVIYLNSSLDKPKQYRYYMGYDRTSPEKANNEVFTVWDWNQKVNFPIIGSTHALLKLRGGLIEGYRFESGYASAYQYDYNPYGAVGQWAMNAEDTLVTDVLPIILDFCAVALLAWLGGEIASGLNLPGPGGGGIPCPHGTGAGGTSGPGTSGNHLPAPGHHWWDLGINLNFPPTNQPQPPLDPNTGQPCQQTETDTNNSDYWAALGATLLNYCAWALAAFLAVAGLLVLVIFFSALIRWAFGFRKDEYETCLNIRHFFCDTPYVSGNTETTLFRNLALSNIYPNYHNDGCYYYNQVGGRVILKAQNQITAGWFSTVQTGYDNQGHPTFTNITGPQSAVLPDVPTMVTNFDKLTILCYTSGKPLPYCGGRTIFYNDEFSTVLTPKEQDCCDLELCGDVKIIVPSGTTFSCVSQEDANSQAELLFNYQVEYALTHHIAIALPNEAYGDVWTRFTHELKIETIPTYASLTFDARISPTPRVGMKMYYDGYGCTLALDGYYAVTGDTVNTPYRTFYHTKDGTIDAIEYMDRSTSTTTRSGLPILTNNLEFSSNWYLTENNSVALTTWSNVLLNMRHFNPNSLYAGYTYVLNGINHTYQLKKGFIKTPITHQNFQLYNDFNGTAYSEAAYGWYKPLIEWIYESNFYYGGIGDNYTLDISEMCGYLNGTTGVRGIYITCLNSNNIPTGPDVQLFITIKFFDSQGNLLNPPNGTQFIFVIGQSTQFFTIPIPNDADLNSMVVVGLSVANPTYSQYTIGNVETCSKNICNQIWTRYNLDITHYQNGDPIPEVTDPIQWSNLTTGAWCYYNNDSSTNSTYGKLYNWYAVNDPRGLAPIGWRIPTGYEYSRFINCVSQSDDAGGKLKEIGTTHWFFPNQGATDEYDFTAVPGGYRASDGFFSDLYLTNILWASTSPQSNLADSIMLVYNSGFAFQGTGPINSGYSVRCIKR